MKIVKAQWLLNIGAFGAKFPTFTVTVEDEQGNFKTYYNEAAARLLTGKTLT